MKRPDAIKVSPDVLRAGIEAYHRAPGMEGDALVEFILQGALAQFAKGKQSSSRMSTLASRAVRDPASLTRSEIKSLAASVLSQDTTPGQRVAKATKSAVGAVVAKVKGT